MKVTVMCAVGSNGEFIAMGDSESQDHILLQDVDSMMSEGINVQLYSLVMDLPIPEPLKLKTIEPIRPENVTIKEVAHE